MVRRVENEFWVDRIDNVFHMSMKRVRCKIEEWVVDDIMKFGRNGAKERTFFQHLLVILFILHIHHTTIRKAIKQLSPELILVAFVLHFEVSHPYRIASDQQPVSTGQTAPTATIAISRNSIVVG